MSERKTLYDELCRLLVDYEGNGSSEIPTAADLYDMLVKISVNWETVITVQDE